MGKQEIKYAAEKFCEGIDWNQIEDYELCAKFAQSLIDNGVLVEATEFHALHVEYEKYKKIFESTVSSAGKEVKSVEEVIEDYYKESKMPISLADIADEDVIPLDDCIKLMKLHSSQFKSSQASTVNGATLDHDVLISYGFEEIGSSYFHLKMSGLYVSRPYKEAKHYLVKSNGQDKLTMVASVEDLSILYRAITGEWMREQLSGE